MKKVIKGGVSFFITMACFGSIYFLHTLLFNDLGNQCLIAALGAAAVLTFSRSEAADYKTKNMFLKKIALIIKISMLVITNMAYSQANTTKHNDFVGEYLTNIMTNRALLITQSKGELFIESKGKGKKDVDPLKGEFAINEER